MGTPDERRIVMTRPDHYEISYAINPWMNPGEWARDPAGSLGRARGQWAELAANLEALGFVVEHVPGEPGLPDMVFPANAAIVLDGKVLLARFRYAERRGEEAYFLRYFLGLKERGLVASVQELPHGIFQEGAGECVWDSTRQMFWAGYGQRSTRQSLDAIGAAFGQPVVGLELATPHYYHLDTCFLVLDGGEIVYYPGAFPAATRDLIATIVPASQRIEATADEAAAFALNAVNLGRDLVMAPPPPRLHALLEDRGYRIHAVDLSSFKLSGGAAFCLTLRLDRKSRSGPAQTDETSATGET